MLCLGYRLDLMRRFLGPRWSPCHVTLAGGGRDGRTALADVLGCEVGLGSTMTLVFPVALLEAPNPMGGGPISTLSDLAIADGGDIVRVVEATIALDLLDAIPSLDRIADRLELLRRDLQRRLAVHGASFQVLRQIAQARRAFDWLADPERSVTTIAQDLGYADPAHFTRAFRSWTRFGPQAWRKRAI